MSHRSFAACAFAFGFASLSGTAAAQDPAPAAGAPSARPAVPVVSGTIRGNYHYLLGGPNEDFNQFAVERVYLTVRGPVAPRTTFRVTSDVYQSGDANGWTVRMKYAYLDYALNTGAWATALRAGILQTVAIEPQETYWPRWLGPVAIDRHGFFQSADAGVSATTTLPGEMGEVFAHVVNGTGYTRREIDRYKDFGARVSLTPFASRYDGLLGSVALTGWVYEGARAGTIEALQRDRWGIHAAADNPRLTLAADHSRRTDVAEDTTFRPGEVGFTSETEGSVTSAFAIVRPFGRVVENRKPAFGLVGRYDHVEPGVIGDTDYHYLLGGAIYALNSRFAVSLNYQEQLGSPSRGPFRGVFANVVLDF